MESYGFLLRVCGPARLTLFRPERPGPHRATAAAPARWLSFWDPEGGCKGGRRPRRGDAGRGGDAAPLGGSVKVGGCERRGLRRRREPQPGQGPGGDCGLRTRWSRAGKGRLGPCFECCLVRRRCTADSRAPASGGFATWGWSPR